MGGDEKSQPVALKTSVAGFTLKDSPAPALRRAATIHLSHSEIDRRTHQFKYTISS